MNCRVIVYVYIYKGVYVYIYKGVSLVGAGPKIVITILLWFGLTHLYPPLRSTFAVRETASLGQQMLNATVGTNGLIQTKARL